MTRIWNEKKSHTDGVMILKNLLDFLLANDTNEETGCDNMSAILIEFIWFLIGFYYMLKTLII